jgi:hypothetical protein
MNRHRVEHFVQQLEGPMEVYFYPTGGLFDALARVVGTPTLHERQP